MAEDEDDDIIGRLLAGGPMQELGNIQERQLDVGEKANDAEDYEDIGDDELADDEIMADALEQDFKNQSDIINTEVSGPAPDAQYEEQDDDLDDLFGDRGGAVSPLPDEGDGVSPAADQTVTNEDNVPSTQDQQTSFESTTVPTSSYPQASGRSSEEEEEDPEVLEQMRLFQQAHRDREMPAAPETNDELFQIIFPQFEADKPPRFSELLPTKRAHYVDKKPLKPPKPLHMNKVNLEIEPDQEKPFRMHGPARSTFIARKAEAEAQGNILTVAEQEMQDSDEEEDMNMLGDDSEGDGPFKWLDVMAVCQDWNIPDPDQLDSIEDLHDKNMNHDSGFESPDDLFGEGENDDLSDAHIRKKQKTSGPEVRPLPVFQDIPFSFDDPDSEILQLAKKVILDENDPHMLLDIQKPNQANDRKRTLGQFKRDNARGLTKDFFRRYNISNDDAYDQLKENRQSKIRSNLGGLAIEHSLPAARLQYPFYKVLLSDKEARSFHRPPFHTEPVFAAFSKPKHFKRKEQRRKPVQELFADTTSLSQADNSHMLLLEYSEEYPAMMSSFGMGNRLINYYRRRDEADHSRPKNEVGETEVLTLEDKSPFSIFGDVDPGTTMPTISNAMYRAPVFAHETNPTDFLLIGNRTVAGGHFYYLKNVENLFVVGQEFPSVEVPGTHSRKVTDASKKRLRMLAHRIYRKHGKLKNDMILDHLPGSDIAQNRSKMREFMNYDKDKGWQPREAEVPEESTIRSWIKPEDICLLDSMQVGNRQLKDAGYNRDDDLADDDDDRDEREGQSIDEQLAPWKTTKNFLNACQGKAMLQLHGEGDPSGRGLAFNLIRTSMKGGFKAMGESVEERLSGNKLKELGGHSYNVARQQKLYNDTIRKIWDAQKQSLSSKEQEDIEWEDNDEIEPTTTVNNQGQTPSSALTGRVRRDEETGSVFSRTSAGSQSGKTLRIKRYKKLSNGHTLAEEKVVRDPKVIREYMKRRYEAEYNRMRFASSSIYIFTLKNLWLSFPLVLLR